MNHNRGDKEEHLLTILHNKKYNKIHFSAFNFKCRYLELFGGSFRAKSPEKDIKF